ncbi:hypothetical protein PQX77_005894 [Marasmius sp. AFHP31]|nr:hypothetical protein PQX77_005894 [Marasmius sp. AFHP31]
MSLVLIELPPSKVIGETMGAALIGVIIAAILYGVTFLQAWNYYAFTVPDMPEDRRDGLPMKSLVALVLLFDTVHMVLISHTLYTYLIINYGNPPALGSTVWSLLLEVLFNGFVALLVQSFLTLRIWRLSNGNKIMTGIAYALVLAEFGCITSFAIIGLARVKTFAELASMLKGLSITVNALAVAGDVYIALALCYLLYRSKTGYKKSDTMVWRLSVYALETGLVTSACALGSLISIIAAPNTFIYICFFFCIGRLYANSLLANLNIRPHVRRLADNINYDSTLFNELRFATSGTASRTLSRHTAGISIQIDTVRMQQLDIEADDDCGKDEQGQADRPRNNPTRSKSLSIHLSDVAEEDSDGKLTVSSGVSPTQDPDHPKTLASYSSDCETV